MKILLEPKSYTIVKGAILLVAVVLVAYVAYAATTATVSNTGTISTTGKNWQAQAFTTQPASCPASTDPNYKDATVFTYPSVPASGAANAWYCVVNISSSPQAFTISTTATTQPTPGTISITYSDAGHTAAASFTSASIPAAGTDLITVNVSANSVATGAFGFTTSVS